MTNRCPPLRLPVTVSNRRHGVIVLALTGAICPLAWIGYQYSCLQRERQAATALERDYHASAHNFEDQRLDMGEEWGQVVVSH